MSIRKTIELVTNSGGRYITPSGLSIIGNMLSRGEFVQYCNQRRDLPKRSEPQIPNGDIMLTMIGLLVQGKPQFDSVNEMKSDPEYYRIALGLKRGVPSSETLRQRLDSSLILPPIQNHFPKKYLFGYVCIIPRPMPQGNGESIYAGGHRLPKQSGEVTPGLCVVNI